MHRTLRIAAATLGLATLLAAASAPAQTDGRELVMSRCTACHSTVRICRFLGMKDVQSWMTTIHKMVGKGAKLDTPEQLTAAAWLAGLPAKSKPVCE